MSPSNSHTLSSAAVTMRLAANGRNWKDWVKQLVNYAAAEGANKVLDGSRCPTFDASDGRYATQNLLRPKHKERATDAEIKAELERVAQHNKILVPFNKEARLLRKEDKQKMDAWVAQDARLQNTILSSIDKALMAQVRKCKTANDMYKALKDLYSNGEYANTAAAWTAFIDCRAENLTTVRAYIGKFRETVHELTVQGITIGWKKPSGALFASMELSLDELLVMHFLFGLSKVLPQWVEARNNDVRQGNNWTVDTLVASLEDHLRNTAEDPVKAFTTIAKQNEEKRVLSRINSRNNQATGSQNSNSVTAPPSRPSNNNSGTSTLKPTGFCNHCQKEHQGPNKLCWFAHPELMPPHIKKKREESAARKAASARTNVSRANSQSDNNSNFDIHTPTAVMASSTIISNTANLQKYLSLPQKGKIIAEYIWIDGCNGTATLGIKYQGDCHDADISNPDHTIGLKAYSDSAHGDCWESSHRM